ncbi:uncharacterized protein LOC107045620, partial [Diachasma alloeum]|uniref:uncharacterized protein LOC107045620 n=1 Tax=Diachasma alloeum TaxID=454923 RepID=UPI00073826E5
AIWWEKLTAGRSICEKHFLPDEYVWQRELRAPNGTIIGVSPYTVPRLKPGVIPSVFPWPSGKTPVDASEADWKEWNAPKKIVSESDSQRNGAVSETESLDEGLGPESPTSSAPSLPRSPASSPLPPLESTPATASPTSPAVTSPASDKSNLAIEGSESTAIFQEQIETDFDISSPWVKGITKDLAGRNVMHFSLMKMAKIAEMVTPVIVHKSIVEIGH